MAEFRLSNFTSGVALTAAELNTGLTFTDYTPTFTQSVAITKTVNWARYTRFGKLVIGTVKMTATSAGTANNKILVGLPVNASSNNFLMGSMVFFNAAEAGNTAYGFAPGAVLYESASTVAFTTSQPAVAFAASRTDSRFGQDFTTTSGGGATGLTVASGDIIYVQFQYEAA